MYWLLTGPTISTMTVTTWRTSDKAHEMYDTAPLGYPRVLVASTGVKGRYDVLDASSEKARAEAQERFNKIGHTCAVCNGSGNTGRHDRYGEMEPCPECLGHGVYLEP